MNPTDPTPLPGPNLPLIYVRPTTRLVTDLLSEASLKRTGYFDPAKVQRLTAKFRQQDGRLVSKRENMALVAILSTQLLEHQFIQNFPDYSKDLMNQIIEAVQK